MLLRVAFLTINERYFLRSLQNRIGPNKPSLLGLLIAFLDGIKLLIIEYIIILFRDFFLFIFCPLLFIFLRLFFFLLLFKDFKLINIKLEIIIILLLISFLILFLILLSYLRKSKFRLIGSLRRVNRTLNFDILFFIIILFFIYLFEELNFIKNIFFILFFILILIFIILIEINRIPFDFLERERELVRGFNTELRGLIFILIFLGEYIIIIFYSLFIIKNLFNNNYFFGIFLIIIFLIIRGVFIRFRYDILIIFCWLIILPLLIFFYFFVIFFYF